MDANTWLREYQQEAQERLGRAQEAQQRIREATAAAQSPDGAVRVTVGPTGALKNLEITPRAGQLTHAQLAQVILRTAQEAHRQVAQQMAQAVKPLIGDSEAMAFLESQIPAADQGSAAGHSGPPPRRPSAGEEDEPGSILR
ncbi:YbaB/EbfC family nucleoid-associated protein [Gandjariella thermophila]|uniref:DNA-binding protein n=1 Tax=Gandjariella thermophila TaxID=1931992 RepID=A0A4D4J184_9PSEU|nr:YbaB/EbfC family nucleoid-associated protein [Gandjariella thermophila]GDY28910.1 DNA-binding protein [Gandjariella thermophila]